MHKGECACVRELRVHFLFATTLKICIATLVRRRQVRRRQVPGQGGGRAQDPRRKSSKDAGLPPPGWPGGVSGCAARRATAGRGQHSSSAHVAVAAHGGGGGHGNGCRRRPRVDCVPSIPGRWACMRAGHAKRGRSPCAAPLGYLSRRARPSARGGRAGASRLQHAADGQTCEDATCVCPAQTAWRGRCAPAASLASQRATQLGGEGGGRCAHLAPAIMR